MLNFVLCDDNSNILKQTTKMLEFIFLKHDFDAYVSFVTTNAQELIEHIRQNKVDVLLLDINLKDNISGIEVAKKVRTINKELYLIFTTGHLEYAMLAYKVKTFDYLAKPITPERLEETIIRVFEDITRFSQNFIKVNSTIINPNDILYIKRDGMKLVLCTTFTNHELYSSFTKINSSLPDNFVRCHKSYIVNINKISNIDINTNTISFNDQSQCYIGPKYKNKFMEVLKNHGNFSNNLDSFNHTKYVAN